MSERKAMIDRYFEGFRRSDHARILDCLTDDVVWDLPGFVFRFAFCTAFTFVGQLIRRVESYIVPLTTAG